MRIEKATLGGGCFWCIEAVFLQVKGVMDVVSGYAGGHVVNPTYFQVCEGWTGHAEVVQITFDADTITYREILEIFFAIHDPTTLNRQGADIGSQYRSVIFYHSQAQCDTARDVMAEMAKVWQATLVTELLPLPAFYPAEDFHRDFYRQNPEQQYCMYIIEPKLAEFRKKFAGLLKTGQ